VGWESLDNDHAAAPPTLNPDVPGSFAKHAGHGPRHDGRDRAAEVVVPCEDVPQAMRQTQHPLARSSGCTTCSPGSRVFVGSNDGRFYALDAASGREVWHFESGAPFSASPAVAAGRLPGQDGACRLPYRSG